MSIAGRTLLVGGAVSSSVQLSFSNSYLDVSRYEGPNNRIPEATLSLILLGMSNKAYRHAENMLGVGNLLSMGVGWLCKACGDYNPAGTIMCTKCGGPAKMMPFVAPSRFPFVLTDLSCESFSDERVVNMDFVSTGPITSEVQNQLFSGGSIELIPSGVVYAPGFFLCKFCGLAVRDGETCPGCAGRRFPWQELASLSRICVYCGSTVLGGVVCQGCGAGLKGTLLSEVV